ncbi:ATP phosphoribosyltransferase [Herpetosiphon llansteffanensis]|uniref:ATP phosphoribosyltransferase n=1 Tax=Herpetosiphon llansteffanensis TaxID=2094568 RepID=UPI000D7C6943|nr:ATP phosphoribosyltransferase [Herpetosiphon llansteffanensis]
MLRFAVPSKGALADDTFRFFESCGLKISRPNPRRYTASIKALPEVEVLLNRVPDIVEKVAEGSIDLGVSGYDLVEELGGESDDLVVVYKDLGFGYCDLVLAVPDHWIDVTSWRDVADLAAEYARSGRQLRIATKFPNLVRQWCHQQGINVFALIDSQGATEAAPSLGYADIIADLTATGTTLRDNHLKMIQGGTILQAQAALIANRRSLRESPQKQRVVQSILELIEARHRAKTYVSLIANVPGADVADVGARVVAHPALAGLQGPTVSPVWSRDGGDGWYAVSLVVDSANILPAIDHLRSIGSSGITVLPVHYVFAERSQSFAALSELMHKS